MPPSDSLRTNPSATVNQSQFRPHTPDSVIDDSGQIFFSRLSCFRVRCKFLAALIFTGESQTLGPVPCKITENTRSRSLNDSCEAFIASLNVKGQGVHLPSVLQREEEFREGKKNSEKTLGKMVPTDILLH